MSNYLTPRKAAEFLGVSITTVRRWLDTGRITKHTFNGYNIAIEREELEKLAKVKEA